ncbi:MAG: hypothetical protein Q9175_005245, partial [Cornicularia normoerica]
MFSPTIIAGLLLGLSQIPSGIAQPVNTSNVVITHVASDYFPNAKSDLSPFDVDVRFVGYNAKTQSWLTGLDPASGSSDEEKAMMITAAAYAKPFDANDPDMTEDVNSLLAAINGNATAVQKRDGSSFQVATAHAVKWATCAGVFSCLSAGPPTVSEPASFLLLGLHATKKLMSRKGLQPLAKVMAARLRAVMSASVT